MNTRINHDGRYNYMVIPGLKIPLLKEDLQKLRAVSDSHLFNSVATIVCEEVNVKLADLFTKSRKGDIPLARQLISYYLFMFGNLELKQIAYLMRPDNPLDHSTIIHQRQVIADALKTRDPFGERIQELVQNIAIKLKQLCK